MLPWAEPPASLFAHLEVDPSTGLSSGQVEARLAQYGPNTIPDEPRRPRGRT